MQTEPPQSNRRRIGIALGPALFLLILFFVSPPEMPRTAVATLAATAWIATWWVTEAIPIAMTSLLPVVLFPALGVEKATAITSNYGNHIVFLFLGGFLIALAIERWNLHRRIALGIVSWMGVSPGRLVLGFMMATALLSMWISNTATAMMMLPIGLAVVSQVAGLQAQAKAEVDGLPPRSNFGAAMMLGIAYAASIGGAATLIGTPPNSILAGVAEKNLGIEVGFLQWMLFGVPLSLLLLGATWGLLMKLLPAEKGLMQGGQAVVRQQLAEMGPITTAERRVLFIFVLVSTMWVLRPFFIARVLPGVNDTVIAIAGSLLLFLLPGDGPGRPRLLEADAIGRVPWGILLLFGGGFALANAFQVSGLAQWLGSRLSGLEGAGLTVVLAVVATVLIFLTEVTSNTATASLFMPIFASLGPALGVSPLGLMAAGAVATSCAFMLPVATPPNAIVFGSGYLTIPQMARVGFWLNLLGVVVITLMARFWMPLVWGF